MMMTVLAGVCGAGEEGEGGNGAGGASMVRAVRWDVRGAVTALRLGVVQLCRVSRDFSTRATGGDFEATFASAKPALGKPPIRAYPLGLHEGCFNARAGLYRWVLWASKRAGFCSLEPV
jgi:hypothetical protein